MPAVYSCVVVRDGFVLRNHAATSTDTGVGRLPASVPVQGGVESSTNESFCGLFTGEPLYVQFDANLLEKNTYKLAVYDLVDSFSELYNNTPVLLDDSEYVRNNSILIGGEDANLGTKWLVDQGYFDPAGRLAGKDGYYVGNVTWGGGTNASVVVCGADERGDLHGVEWFIDRLETQPLSTLRFDDLVTPGMEMRQNYVGLYCGASYPEIVDPESTRDENYWQINQTARQMSTGITIFGTAGQYPELLNFTGLDVPGFEVNASTAEWKKAWLKQYVDYAKSLGLEVFFWSDQLNYLDQAVIDWFKGAGPVDLDNERVVQFLQYEVREIFAAFPNADGVHWRVGDDLYAQNSYKLVHTPETFRKAAQVMMGALDPLGKKFILRTWQMSIDCVHSTPGKYLEAFGDLYYPNLIVSIKYTPSDYQRFPVNPTINVGNLKQVVEFQVMTSFENYQYTPNYLGEWYEGVLANVTSAKNGTGPNAQNLVAGVALGYNVNPSPTTSNVEGPGSEGSFRWNYNSYYIWRASIQPSVNATEVARDYAAMTIGKDAREPFGEWLLLSGRAHFNLLYIRGHREAAPWLKSHLLHYTRAFRAAPDVVSFIYHYSKDVENAIDGLELGLNYSIKMREIAEGDLPALVGGREENLVYFNYYRNESAKFVRFANLTYWFGRTILEYYKWMDSLDPAYRHRWHSSLVQLKGALVTYDTLYHYYYDPERGHKEGLEQVKGFVHWLEVTPTIEACGLAILTTWLASALLLVAWRLVNRRGGSVSGKKTRDETGASNPVEFPGRTVKLAPCVLFSLVVAFNGLLFEMSTFFTHAGLAFWLGASITLGGAALAFSFHFIALWRRRSTDGDGPVESQAGGTARGMALAPLGEAFTSTSRTFIAMVPVQFLSALYLALKGPMGIFCGPVTIPVLAEPRFGHFTALDVAGLLVILSGLSIPFACAALAVKSHYNGTGTRAAVRGALLTFALGLAGLAVAFGVFLAWFPGFLADVDLYINSALGIYSPVEFYS
ncbi:MAG: hypothetical protein ACTSU5_02820 [Promethearchaeota archaeon]